MTRYCPETEILPATVKSFFSSRFELLPGLPALYYRLQKPAQTVLSLIETETIAQRLDNSIEKERLLQLLSPEENTLFASFSYPKRQKEWLAGRLACKFSVLQLLSETFSGQHSATFSVLPGKNGVPELVFQEPPLSVPSVSISHSGEYAVAMAGFAVSCGIDIQGVTAKIMNVVSRFAAPAELQILENSTPEMKEQQRLTLLWSAKEALKKSLLSDQPVIFKGITLQGVSGDKTLSLQLTTSLAQPGATEVTAYFLDDYVLAHTASGVKHA